MNDQLYVQYTVYMIALECWPQSRNSAEKSGTQLQLHEKKLCHGNTMTFGLALDWPLNMALKRWF